tara:strand:+ start:45083 stop:45817 length:735 start_codon:yes stop_codon:yes gene_type:complete
MTKSITFLFIAILLFSCSNDGPRIDYSENLLIHYPFSGNSDDQSGNGFDGSSNATLTKDRFDKVNSAYSFNGQNEYIDLPNFPSLKPQFPVSFSFWVKFDDLLPENTVIFTTDFEQDNHSGVWMNLSGGKVAINYGDASGNTTSSNRRTKVGTTTITPDKWYHVIGIIEGPTNMEIFIDCNNDQGSYSGSGGDLDYTLNPGSIGRKDGNTNFSAYYFSGTLDNFRYWNRTLTLDEISTLCIENN